MENGGAANMGSGPKHRPRVVVVGSGFAGFTCIRELEKRLGPEDAELILVSPTDYMLYSPLLPEVAAGAMDPRHIVVPLHGALKRARVVLGYATGVDLDACTCTVSPPNAPERVLEWDRLVLAPGGVTRSFPIPGLAERARGFKTLAEALYLRDHVLQQLELADASNDPDERRARCTFVVVGAGYSGTECAAQMQLFSKGALANYPGLEPGELRWMLLDVAPRVLPELGEHLGEVALGLLRQRGVEIRLQTSIEEANEESLKLSDGTTVPTHTLVWCAGVAASPLVATLGLPLERGRLVVNERLFVAGRPDVFALGDCAAVPDLARPGNVTPPTAQHALRQARTAARNVAASLGHGRSRPYRHKDLGLVVDLGSREAVAKPLGVSLSGLTAKAVTRAYHLYALPSTPQRLRVGLDWALDAFLSRPLVQLGLVREEDAPLATAERTGIYAVPQEPAKEGSARTRTT
jgi:NADH:ubiquinone reductase (H+-translocating)